MASKTFHKKRLSWESKQRFNCEGKILACKKNKLCLISILYIMNTNEECFIRYKAHAPDALSVF